MGRSLAVKTELPQYEQTECPHLYALLGVQTHNHRFMLIQRQE
jgi:hypothetical protein